MAIGNQITIVGNLTDDPELRFTPSGAPVATFTVAVNRRFRDENGVWKDGETSFFRCNVWRAQAENVAESLAKGTRAIVIGRLRTRTWDGQDGQKRSATEIEVEHCGPSLEWAKATVEKVSRTDGAPAFAGVSASPSNGSNGGESPAFDEEPPF